MHYTDLALDAKTLARVTPAAGDVACPSCGARLCVGRLHTAGFGSRTTEQSAYCVLSGHSSLGRLDCNWAGTIRVNHHGHRTYVAHGAR